MPQFLAFTLYAPLASFGAVAVGERRPGWDRPARSALVGLLRAALGLAREDEAAHSGLDTGYGFAVRVDRSGTPFTDYHTVQVPPQQRGRRHATRRDELASASLETVLTRREYRTDAMYTVAIWMRGDRSYPLSALADALTRPRFTLSLGRKSCPLGLPLAPTLIDAEDVLAALARRDESLAEPERRLRRSLRAAPGLVALDKDGVPAGVTPHRIERRRDLVVS